MEANVEEVGRMLHQNTKMYINYAMSLKLMEIGGQSLLFIGSVFNILAIILFFHPRNRYHPIFILLAALSCADLIGLWTYFAPHLLIQIYDIHMETHSIIGCKFYVFLKRVSLQFSSCLLMAMTTERLIAILFPGNVKMVCSRWNTGIITAVILSMLVLLNIYVFKDYTVRNYYDDNDTYILSCENVEHSGYNVLRHDVWYWIHFCLITILPVIYLCIANIFLLVNVSKVKSNLDIKSLDSFEKGEFRSKRHDFLQLSFTIILLNFCFIIFTTPSRLYLFIIEVEFPKRPGNIIFLWPISYLLSSASYVLNFIIYYLSLPKFRKDVRELFVDRLLNLSRGINNLIPEKLRHR